MNERLERRRGELLDLLRTSGKTMRTYEITDVLGLPYHIVYQDLRVLERQHQVEVVRGVELARYAQLGDGRRVLLGAESGAIGWRAIAVDASTLADLEALYAAPHSKRPSG